MPDAADVERDESVRVDTSLERLATLKPVFRPDGTVTAGNSSPLNDGAAALLLGDEEASRRTGKGPLARIVGRAVTAVEPQLFGIGPVQAARLALKRAGVGWDDLSVVERNEAFAAQSLACLAEWADLDPDIVNQRGGAIALGHPLGCSGAAHPGLVSVAAARTRRRLGPRRNLHRRGPGAGSCAARVGTRRAACRRTLPRSVTTRRHGRCGTRCVQVSCPARWVQW